MTGTAALLEHLPPHPGTFPVPWPVVLVFGVPELPESMERQAGSGVGLSVFVPARRAASDSWPSP
jgi:hypothetical protein